MSSHILRCRSRGCGQRTRYALDVKHAAAPQHCDPRREFGEEMSTHSERLPVARDSSSTNQHKRWDARLCVLGGSAAFTSVASCVGKHWQRLLDWRVGF